MCNAPVYLVVLPASHIDYTNNLEQFSFSTGERRTCAILCQLFFITITFETKSKYENDWNPSVRFNDYCSSERILRILYVLRVSSIINRRIEHVCPTSRFQSFEYFNDESATHDFQRLPIRSQKNKDCFIRWAKNEIDATPPFKLHLQTRHNNTCIV